MRLLKTVLLSTTLMMGAAFGADAAVDDQYAEYAKTSAAEYAEVLESFQRFKESTASAIIRVMTRDAGVDPKLIKVSKNSAIAPVLNAIKDVIKTLVAERDQLKSSLETQTGYLTDPEAVFARLTREKAAIEEALAEVAEAKAGVAGELVDAQDEVARLTVALEAAREAGEASSGVISEFSTELAAENESVRALSEKETELESEIQKLQLELRTLEKAKAQLVNAFAN